MRGSGWSTAAVASTIFFGVVACARSSNMVTKPVDVAIGTVKEAPQAGIASGRAKNGTCTVWLTAEPIQKSSSGCYMDQHVSEEPGILVYPCSGDGPADARFGEHRYRGSVAGGTVKLELDTELDWEDGCKWGTHHVVRGELTKDGEPVLGKLTWRYADRVLQGTNCSGECTAKTELAVTEPTPTGNSPSRPRPIIEPDDSD